MDIVFAGPESDYGELLWEEPLVRTGTIHLPDHPTEPIDLALMHAPCSYRQIAFDALTKAERPWKLSIEANTVQAVQSAIQAGLGVSVLPLSVVQDGVAVKKSSLPKLPNTSVMSYVKSGQAHPYSQRFIDFLPSGIEGSPRLELVS